MNRQTSVRHTTKTIKPKRAKRTRARQSLEFFLIVFPKLTRAAKLSETAWILFDDGQFTSDFNVLFILISILKFIIKNFLYLFYLVFEYLRIKLKNVFKKKTKSYKKKFLPVI